MKHYKLRTCMVMQVKRWMTSFLFKEFFSFFKKTIPRDIFQSNWCLLVLDGHDSLVMLEAIKLTQEFGLDMVTFIFHTFHALQLMNMNCFKHFKIVFMKDRDDAMVRNNHCELNNCTFIGWVNKVLDHAL